MKQEHWLKVYVIDVLPIITIALYILAAIYNVAYYSVYGINIIPYLTIGEMLMSIIEPLVLFLLIMLGSICAYCILDFSIPKLRLYIIKNKNKQSFVKIKMGVKWFLCKLTRQQERNNFKTWIKLIKTDWKKKTYFRLIELVLFSIPVSVFMYWFGKYNGNVKGMLLAVIAMFFPLYIGLSPTWAKKDNITNIKIANKMDVAISIFMYYLYCIMIFYDCGKECALYNQKADDVSFKIETTNGVLFTDKDYGYIEQLNNSYLLFDRQTTDVVVLYTSNVMSAKINLGERGMGLVPSIVSKSGNIYGRNSKKNVKERKK